MGKNEVQSAASGNPHSLPQLVNETKLEEVTGIKRSRWRHLRWSGGGPEFIKVGESVFYDPAVVAAWINQHTVRRNTSEVV